MSSSFSPTSPTPNGSIFRTLFCTLLYVLKDHGDHSVSAHIYLSDSSQQLKNTSFSLLKDTEVASNITTTENTSRNNCIYRSLGNIVKKTE